jgi:hypothetical protein
MITVWLKEGGFLIYFKNSLLVALAISHLLIPAAFTKLPIPMPMACQ